MKPITFDEMIEMIEDEGLVATLQPEGYGLTFILNIDGEAYPIIADIDMSEGAVTSLSTFKTGLHEQMVGVALDAEEIIPMLDGFLSLIEIMRNDPKATEAVSDDVSHGRAYKMEARYV